MFDSPNVIPIEAFKNLHTIVGDNKINTATFSHINIYPKQWQLCAPRTATATMWLLKTEPCIQARVMKGWSIKWLRGTLKRKCLAIYYNHVVFENLKNSQNPQSKQTTIVWILGLHHTYFKQATRSDDAIPRYNTQQQRGFWVVSVGLLCSDGSSPRSGPSSYPPSHHFKM